jgi:di/tricarboxylate transporter
MPPSSLIPESNGHGPAQPDDGTRQLLEWGGSIVGAGALAGVLLMTVLGGFSRTGASTNAGWFALIVVMGCIPFGGLLLTLGVAKWLRNRRIAHNGDGRRRD